MICIASCPIEGCILYYSVFFSNVLATDKGAGMEVLPGTPLRMPDTPDYESFRKSIAQVCKHILPVTYDCVMLLHVASCLIRMPR